MIRSAFLLVCCGNRQTDEIRRESPWTMMFADDLAIFGESRELVEKIYCRGVEV